jgi:hypothetical protein
MEPPVTLTLFVPLAVNCLFLFLTNISAKCRAYQISRPFRSPGGRASRQTAAGP